MPAMQLPGHDVGDDFLEHKLGNDLFAEIKALFFMLIERDTAFLLQALLYGFAISLLTLAVPVAVQMLINSIAHTASLQAVISLALVLFVLLIISGTFTALQTYTTELFERRFFARIAAQFTLRNMHAKSRFFEGINRYDLANRYFDIFSMQKNITSLTVGMFTLLLQMLVGIVLVSFYHPWLFVFNLIFIGVVYAIWRIWGYRALGTAIDLSQAKYRAARHIEDVAFSSSFFKSAAHGRHAVAKTDALSERYIKHRKHHFKHTFSQHIATLLLYAFASAMLLGMGGVLVVKNQLTLGQLVAAELVLSAVFYGMSRMSSYLVMIYDLGAAAEEISMVYQIPLEQIDGTRTLGSTPEDIVFEHLVLSDHGFSTQTHFTLKAGQKLLVCTRIHHQQTMLTQALLRHRAPEKGRIIIGEHDISDYEPFALRDRIIVLDRSSMVECTIAQYMRMRTPSASTADINRALAMVEMDERVNELPDGLETPLTVLGGVLTLSERLRLKLAAALLANPNTLILSEIFDIISQPRRIRIFSRIGAITDMSLIYFSSRLDLGMFNGYLYLEPQTHHMFDNLENLRTYEEAL